MCRYSKVQPIRPPWTCDVNIFVVVLLQSRWLLLLMRVVKEKRTRIEAALHQTLTTLFKRFLRNRYYLEPLYGCAATCALTHTRRASVCVRSNRFTFVCRRLANNKRIEKDKWFKSNHLQQLDVCKIVSMWFFTHSRFHFFEILFEMCSITLLLSVHSTSVAKYKSSSIRGIKCLSNNAYTHSIFLELLTIPFLPFIFPFFLLSTIEYFSWIMESSFHQIFSKVVAYTQENGNVFI